MKHLHLIILAFIALSGCSNSSEFETGEIKIINLLRETITKYNTPSIILDTKSIITRKKIDDAKIPVLFIELENGQNGTLTLYPGTGVGETWLGADGTTVTLERGVLKATRGMRNDLIGSTSSMPKWKQSNNSAEYTKTLSYLGGNNQIYSKIFLCKTKKESKLETAIIFDFAFNVRKYTETCLNDQNKLKNIYFIDHSGTVRRSKQYHGPSLGYITIERLDR